MITKTTDQLGNYFEFDQRPQRIISLVPSQTELLYYWGLEERVVGITKFCIHPKEWYRTKPRVGGTKNIDLDKIHALKPDIIIANKEENSKEDIALLQQYYPVWLSDLICLEDVFDLFYRLGNLLDVVKEAAELSQQIQTNFARLREEISTSNKLKVAYFIWQNPYMVAANQTFIHTVLEAAGFQNVWESLERYPQVEIEAIQAAEPEFIFLSSEPYPFQEKHIALFQKICPKARVIIVDGELFSWYGSRLLFTVDYLRKLKLSL